MFILKARVQKTKIFSFYFIYGVTVHICKGTVDGADKTWFICYDDGLFGIFKNTGSLFKPSVLFNIFGDVELDRQIAHEFAI